MRGLLERLRMKSQRMDQSGWKARAAMMEMLESRVLLSGDPWYGSVLNEADWILRSDVAREHFGVDGTGVKIGVISDSFDTLNGFGQDILSGDLPMLVRTFGPEAEGVGADEGRAMLQLIHDIAPGAQLMFYTYQGDATDDADVAAAIRALVDAGADIIVDDVTFFAEPMFQDGKSAQAVDYAVEQGVVYLSSAGNHGTVSYESEYRARVSRFVDPAGNRVKAFDFDPGVGEDIFQQITIPRGETIRLALQWDEPFKSVSGGEGAQTDLDIWLYDQTGKVRMKSTKDNIWETGDPVESLVWTNNTKSTVFNIVITKFAGPNPGYLKYVVLQGEGISIDEYWTPTSTVYGHANADGAMTVGAVGWDSPYEVQSYSALGATPILFDQDGNRLAEPVYRIKPEVVGPDGTSTTVAGFEEFWGTSAAVASVAGVVALMLQAKPGATPLEIYEAIDDSAIDLDDPYTEGWDEGFDYATGFGLVQADRAISTLLGLGSISGSRFVDSDMDGYWDEWEKPLANGLVFLDENGNGELDDEEWYVNTDANGQYRFVGLEAGTYTVCAVAKAGYVVLSPDTAAHTVTVDAKENVDWVDFGELRLGAITGSVYNDADMNGWQGRKEKGLLGTRVYLDTNNNGKLDGSERSTTTDARGVYSFTDLLPGTYRVRALGRDGESWFTTTPGKGVYVAKVQGGKTVGGLVFGMARYSSISGRVFRDGNRNGVRDVNEVGVAGFRVFADLNNNGIWELSEPSALSDVNGDYILKDLKPGSYVIRQVAVKRWYRTMPSAGYYLVRLSGTRDATGLDFGNRK